MDAIRAKTEKVIAEGKKKQAANDKPATLYDFRLRTKVEMALEPGKLKEYIERPISANMSWPPQAAEVKKDLRKYLSKRNYPNV